ALGSRSGRLPGAGWVCRRLPFLIAVILSRTRRSGMPDTKIADSIVIELDQEAQTTKRVLDRVPGDRLSWKPHPKAFSLGQLALHIAAVPGGVAAAAAGDTLDAARLHHAE